MYNKYKVFVNIKYENGIFEKLSIPSFRNYCLHQGRDSGTLSINLNMFTCSTYLLVLDKTDIYMFLYFDYPNVLEEYVNNDYII